MEPVADSKVASPGEIWVWTDCELGKCEWCVTALRFADGGDGAASGPGHRARLPVLFFRGPPCRVPCAAGTRLETSRLALSLSRSLSLSLSLSLQEHGRGRRAGAEPRGEGLWGRPRGVRTAQESEPETETGEEAAQKERGAGVGGLTLRRRARRRTRICRRAARCFAVSAGHPDVPGRRGG